MSKEVRVTNCPWCGENRLEWEMTRQLLHCFSCGFSGRFVAFESKLAEKSEEASSQAPLEYKIGKNTIFRGPVFGPEGKV